MHLDLYQVLGLLNWMFCIQGVDGFEVGPHCDKTLQHLFGVCHVYPVQAMGYQRGSLSPWNSEKLRRANRFVTYFISRTPSRRKRETKAQGNSTDTSKTQIKNTTGSARKTAFAFGNPSLPKKASKRKKPKQDRHG